MARYPEDDYDRRVEEFLPERFEDVDADSRQARAGYRMRSYLTLGAAVIAVGGIVAAGLHFMNNKSTSGSGLQLIKADERPIKVRPTDPGGMQVPNQDKLVYERMEGESEAKVERLLPPPEQPQVPVKNADAQAPKPQPTAEILRPGTPVAARPPLGDGPMAGRAGGNAAAEPTAEPSAPVVKNGASAVGNVPALAAAPPIAPAVPVAAKPGVPAGLPATAASAANTATAVKPGAVNPPSVAASPAAVKAAPPPPVPPKPAPQPPAPTAPVKPVVGGDWLIQLGALRSQADADREWGRIQRANSDVLGGLRSDVMRVDLPDKGTFFRLRAGPVSEQSARQLCNDLKTRNQGCMIVRK